MITGWIRYHLKTRDIVISLGDEQYEKVIANKKQDQMMTMEHFDGIMDK